MNESFNGESWEPVCGGTAGDTWRMRVAGGWIYRHDTWTQDGSGKVSSRHSAMVFVPDPAATTEPQTHGPTLNSTGKNISLGGTFSPFFGGFIGVRCGGEHA